MKTSEQDLIPEVFDEQELFAFDKEMREILEQTGAMQYVVEPGITAVEVVLTYEQGTLRSARAQTGTVTSSIKTILTVPLTFVPLRKETPLPDHIEILADIYMEEAALARLNKERSAKDLPAFPDAREAVQDSLCQTDTRISSKRPMNYFCSGYRKGAWIRSATHYDLMLGLQELGLRVNRPHLRVSKGIHEVMEHCLRLKTEKENFPYPVEGALIRVNSLELQERVRRCTRNQSGSLVFRF
jgi:DNA ligase (NAD+)